MAKSYESGYGNYKLFVDISATATPDYEEVTPMTVGFDSGEELDTWHDLLSNIANNVKTAIDPTWSVTLKFDKDDAVCKFIIAKELQTGSGAVAGCRVVNLLKGTTGKQIDFDAVFSNITYDLETPTVVEVSFDLKVSDGSDFNETDYSASV